MTKLGRELITLRTAAKLTAEAVERRTRGRVSASVLATIEAGMATVPSPILLRAIAVVYGVTPWSLFKLAGYVTDQDAADGIEAMRDAKKRAA